MKSFFKPFDDRDMKSKYIYTAALVACAVAGGTASAQDNLSKEITIEREIVPEIRAASRLNVYPRALSPGRETKTLNFNDYTGVTNIPQAISSLEPAATAAAVPATPYRGYVDAGYFPAANAGLSAGYSILNDDNTMLNVWTQMNNKSYKGRPSEDAEKGTFRQFAGRLGVDFSHRFGRAGLLDISTDAGLMSFNQPWSVIDRCFGGEGKTEGQTVFGWNLDAAWKGFASDHLTYHIGAGFNVFNFSKGIDAVIPAVPDGAAAKAVQAAPVHQTGFNFDLGINEKLNGGSSSVGVDLDGQFVRFNHFADGALAAAQLSAENAGAVAAPAESEGETMLPAVNAPGKTQGVLGLLPYYRFGNDIASVKLGARVEFTFNSGKKFHVAPDVLLAVNPAPGFGAWLGVGGGEHVNTLQSLVAYTPYISQLYAYEVSHMPIKGDLGLRFGPFKGAALTLKLAYASANDWLMPVADRGHLLFGNCNLRSWKAGANVTWSFRRIVTLDAGFETVLGSQDKNSWIEWRDRARHVMSASVDVSPIPALTVEISYELRMKRHMAEVHAGAMPVDVALKNVNNLDAGASYRITDAFTVFARVENLLGSRYYSMPLVPEQGFTGLAGVGYKF